MPGKSGVNGNPSSCNSKRKSSLLPFQSFLTEGKKKKKKKKKDYSLKYELDANKDRVVNSSCYLNL